LFARSHNFGLFVHSSDGDRIALTLRPVHESAHDRYVTYIDTPEDYVRILDRLAIEGRSLTDQAA
jgi:hypothetical protein